MVDAVLPALPGDVVAGEMETDSGQATEMPALNCSEGGDDEDTSRGARDSDRCPGLARARPGRCQGQRRAVSRSPAPAPVVRVLVTSAGSVCLKSLKHK